MPLSSPLINMKKVHQELTVPPSRISLSTESEAFFSEAVYMTGNVSTSAMEEPHDEDMPVQRAAG